MEVLNVFEKKFEDIIGKEIKSVLLENNEENVDKPTKKVWESQTMNSMSCSYCRIDFSDVTTQREHYKLDWHRFNLKQSLLGKTPITEQEFNVKNGNDDISSISGSDSEKEDTLDSFATAQGKIFLQNGEGHTFSLHKCLIFNKKDEIDEKVLVNRLNECCVRNKQWTVFMLGGGHFAGAIFKGNDPILHKTFHCYTVRQGQGGSQSSRDNKSGGSHPKSAGASLRRYNEQALAQHVQDIVEQWKLEIAKSSLIFYRAPGPYNRSVLFGGSNPILQRTDDRVRTIPFSTRRATYTEVQRVQSVLSAAQIYGNLEDAIKHLDKHRLLNQNSKRSRIRCTQINRAKSREIIERPLPTRHSSEIHSLENTQSSENEEGGNNNIELNTLDNEISFDHLQVFEETEKSKGKTGRKKKTKKSKSKKLQEQELKRKNDLLEILHKGNVIKLKEEVGKIGSNIENNELEAQKELRNTFFNEILDDDGNSLLHIAAMNEHGELLEFLLENGSDPCLKNKKLQTPYSSTSSKEIREVMKKFARENPDKYNYNKAQIPTNTLNSEELVEKKKIQKKIKRDKEKVKKEENKIKQKELNEKERFLNLSDREKRALAAERRILSQNGAVVSRCFLCATDMTGKVPFEYLNNRFCTIDCLKAHRIQNPIILS